MVVQFILFPSQIPPSPRVTAFIIFNTARMQKPSPLTDQHNRPRKLFPVCFFCNRIQVTKTKSHQRRSDFLFRGRTHYKKGKLHYDSDIVTAYTFAVPRCIILLLF
jgi:hypothetical protein